MDEGVNRLCRLIGSAVPELTPEGDFDCSDSSRISRAIPRRLKIRIAEAVLAFSELEHMMAITIGAYLKLTEQEMLFYTDVTFNRKVKLVRKLFGEKHDQSTFDQATNLIFPALGEAATLRNLLVHGDVFMWDGEHLVASSRRPRIKPQVSEGRLFTLNKFGWMRATTEHLTTTFSGLAQMYFHPAHQPLDPVQDRTHEGLLDHRDRKRRSRS